MLALIPLALGGGATAERDSLVDGDRHRLRIDDVDAAQYVPDADSLPALCADEGGGLMD